MAWFKRTEEKIKKTRVYKKKDIDNLWTKCIKCNELIYNEDLEKNLFVCPNCQYHFRITASKRLMFSVDEGSFKEINSGIKSADPLNFFDNSGSYKDRIKIYQKKLKTNSAIITGIASIEGKKVVIAILDFYFSGGSMGTVVGEKISRAAELAAKKRYPLIIISGSGGARMQEGMFSLMQMSKTSAAIAVLKKKAVPYISVLTDPTTGGVSASFAMLGDINIAEPEALIGFAGPRVIEQTIKQKLPKGFQRSEFLLEHGFIDLILHRHEMKATLKQIIDLLLN